MIHLLLALFVGASTIPKQPLIETSPERQRLNFDLLYTNDTDSTLELSKLEVTLYDAQGNLVAQQRRDQNGDPSTMSLATIPNRTLPAHGRLVVFNPFWDWPAQFALGRMHYEATFGDSVVSLDVTPKAYGGALLRFPLKGEVFVHDGHDLYGHHRRLDITGGMTTHFGITENFMRYAHDFVITDRTGAMYKGDGAKPEDWYGYGADVLAPADGTIRSMHDGMKDNVKGGPPGFTQEEIMNNLRLFLGNHVVLAHDDGTYSVLAHLKQGSIRVHEGERVRKGQVLGGMGMSGDAFLVHLHYQHQSGPDFEEGLPAYFEHVRVRNGRGWSKPFNGPVDSGDVVDAR